MSANTMKKAIIQKSSQNFNDAVAVTTVPMIQPKPDEVLIKNRFVGINASDLNAAVCHGIYLGKLPPFDFGFEGVGDIVEVGSEVTNLKVGQSVMYTCSALDAFSEYIHLSTRGGLLLPIPESKPEFIPLIISGLTAAIGLDKKGQLKAKDKVLITAAAGGTGHIAVQWAKHVGCHVIGTCSSEEKVQFLKSIGCDRPINYKKEDIAEVLKTEYPEGIDVIWESVGGAMFETLFQHLAENGRFIFLGSVSSYNTHHCVRPVQLPNFPAQILIKSQTISGFILTNFKYDFPGFMKSLFSMQATGQLKITIDIGKSTKEGEFIGIESIKRALQYLYSGKNVGKVVVQL